MYEYVNAYVLETTSRHSRMHLMRSEVSYDEVLGDKIAMYFRVTLY